MAKQKQPQVETSDHEFVDDLYATVDDREVEFANPAEDDLPAGVSKPSDELHEEDEAPAPKKVARQPEPQAEEEELPEEFKGKSPAQIAKMYRDLHSAFGRQGSELGEMRKTYDEFIRVETERRRAERPAPKKEEVKELDDADFLVSPREAIDRYISNHPALQQLVGAQREFAAREIQRQRGETSKKFSDAHPDAKEIWNNPEFRQWINASPIRQALVVRAHQNYDFTAADEIFSTWKALHPKAESEADGGKEKKTERRVVTDKKAGRVPSGGNAAPRQAADGKGGKIYRRTDIVRLMQEDNDRYLAMAEELDQARREGRVR